MKSNGLVLLKTLLMSTSDINIVKTTKDKKKRSKAIGNMIGKGFLYLLVLAYGILAAIGYSSLGMEDALPATAAISVSAMAFIFTMIKANSYLFGFKEYDMLMALPFSEKSVAGDKFLYMYMKSLPWYVVISLSMMIGYGITAKPGILAYILWVVLSFVLPIIPMLLASFLGLLFAKIGSGFKHWKIVQSILIFIFIIACILSRFLIESLIRSGAIPDILNDFSETSKVAGTYYPPIRWFEESILNYRISDMLLLIGLSIVLFELVFILFAKNYKKINTSMKTSVAKRSYKVTKLKTRSIVRSVADKEMKRFFGSIPYLTNMGVGYVLAIVMGIVSLVIGMEGIISGITQGAPITKDMIKIAIPFIVYFMTGMTSTSTASPSLEGKNYWIVKSLPISTGDLYKGKILAALYLAVPSQVISTILICISMRTTVLEAVLFIIAGIVFCTFSAVFGCVTGIRFMKLEWENEIEVVKQGAAVGVYMLVNMLLTMALLVGSVALGFVMNPTIAILLSMLLYICLTAFSAYRVKKLAAKL